MQIVYIVLGLLTGCAFATQGAVNGRLAAHLGGAPMAALVSFTVGWMALLVLNLALRSPLPATAGFSAIPWWAWLGGFMGAFGVASAAFSVPHIGVATWVAAIIAGQLVCALFLDQIGAFGQAVREITPGRLLGVVFLVAGVALIRKF
ncbi:DMT family transporter [Parvularcula sp. LCG005]|uniref:DMT family transporter n=1 Tax=Parvularcula sp. LCG005 TaxID=3078805 RepID=UPI0029421D95|nr:DMT family transporter [Parvularcula sp. LCG005]WOI52410.1 DMT family transporter [Parvularcula sp. LCG005]